MNERIRELEERCWEELGEEECYYTVFNREKFAELIVRECIDVVEGGSFLHDQAPTAIFARECSGAIKRHFGVQK